MLKENPVYLAKAELGGDALNRLKEKGLTVTEIERLERLERLAQAVRELEKQYENESGWAVHKDKCTEELLKRGLTNEDILQSESRVRKLIQERSKINNSESEASNE